MTATVLCLLLSHFNLQKPDQSGEAENEDEVDQGSGNSGALDIMAQQLKFIACLKIMMEELSTLATGFEVDGGLLRYSNKTFH